MKKKFLEAGEIVNTHGIQGELKVLPWCDGPEFLKAFKTFYIDGKAYAVKSSRIFKNMLLLSLKDIDNINAAIPFKGKTLYIDRESAPIAEGRVFIADLIDLAVYADGKEIGKVTEVMSGPANDVYVVKGEREYMIPAVSEFLQEVDIDNGFIRVKLIPGMAADES